MWRVVEGVETSVQLDLLRSQGSHDIQGDLIGGPHPLDEPKAFVLEGDDCGDGTGNLRPISRLEGGLRRLRVCRWETPRMFIC